MSLDIVEIVKKMTVYLSEKMAMFWKATYLYVFICQKVWQLDNAPKLAFFTVSCFFIGNSFVNHSLLLK
jgi:hypothetical protein